MERDRLLIFAAVAILGGCVVAMNFTRHFPLTDVGYWFDGGGWRLVDGPAAADERD